MKFLKPISIYIHWPFCVSKCPYCDFNSHIQRTVDHKQWGQALLVELRYLINSYLMENQNHYYLKSIFFGGGTPSLMEPFNMRKIIEECKQQFPNTEYVKNIEITMEANPSSIFNKNLKEFYYSGINRISIGVQSFNDEFLRFLGRNHSAFEAKKSIELSKEIFENVSFDLIYALPEQSLRSWECSLVEAINFDPEHLSLYQLTIEKGTVFNKNYINGSLIPIRDEQASKMYSLTDSITSHHKINSYEISNYSKKNKNCAHNLMYWKGGDWIGIGPGAISRFFYKNKRTQISIRKNPSNWLKSVNVQNHGINNIKSENKRDYYIEKVLMGLRLTKGINIEKLKSVLNMDKIQTLVKYNYLLLERQNLKTTLEGRLILNSILSEIIK